MKKAKVYYRVIAEEDGWGRRPEVLEIESIDCELTPEEEEKAVQRALYPDGGINWFAWEEGSEDYTIVDVE